MSFVCIQPLEATHHYARIRSVFERAGKSIGGMDMLIAAHALAEDSAIADIVREFCRVLGLAVEDGPLEPL